MAIQGRRQCLLWLFVSSTLLSSSLFSSAVVAAFQFHPSLPRSGWSGSAGRFRRQIDHGKWRPDDKRRRIQLSDAAIAANNAHERPDEHEFSATTRSSLDGSKDNAGAHANEAIGEALELASRSDVQEPYYQEDNDIDSLARRRLLLLSLLASTSSTTIPFFPERASAISKSSSSSSSSSPTIPMVPSQRIIQPPLDERSYLTYTLPSNDLRILLCSDPSTTSAAASMSVHVGACSDPIDIPGLAHFCEHMLFLGTELYPGEDSFSKFLSSNGEIYYICR